MERIEKRKVYGTIIGVIAFVLIILGLTYAYFYWSSGNEKTNVNLTVSRSIEGLIVYNQGTSILGTDNYTLQPSSSYTGGISATIEFWKVANATQTIYGEIYLEILQMLSRTNTTDANIGKTDTIKWAVTTYTATNSTETLLKEGTFNGRSQGNKFALVSNIQLNNYQTFYKIYIWLDENATDPNCSVASELLSTEISASATDYYTGSPVFTLSSYNVNGTPTSTFPTTGTYTVDTSNCEDMTMTYDYTKKGFKISNVSTSDEIVCSPTFTTTTRTTLSNYIKNTLTGTTQGNGQVVNENGYRYEGKNPNNYVLFNDELWRIIGVFDQNSHGQTGQYLTKIIREERIGGLAWDKSDVNNWATSSLYNLLNGAYYNAEDGTNSGYCYGYRSSVTANCDYTTSGIQDEYRSMVKNVTWYLGGYSSNSVTADNMYTYERSSDDTYYYTNNTSNKTVTGNIGLMYVSDYGYSVLSGSCARTINVDSYRTNACAGNSWLYGNGHEWTVGHSTSSSAYVFYVSYVGNVNSSYNACIGFATRPVLYLNSLVYIINGTGSKSDPYIIGM